MFFPRDFCIRNQKIFTHYIKNFEFQIVLRKEHMGGFAHFVYVSNFINETTEENIQFKKYTTSSSLSSGSSTLTIAVSRSINF